MTPTEAAEVIGCTDRHVRWLIKQNAFARVKRKPLPGNNRFVYDIPRASVKRYRDGGQATGFPRGKKRK